MTPLERYQKLIRLAEKIREEMLGLSPESKVPYIQTLNKVRAEIKSIEAQYHQRMSA